MLKVGVIKERKPTMDNRVAMLPRHCLELQKKVPNAKVFVESSNIRCFTDKEYEEAGLPVVDDVSHCDILIGVKEVPIDHIIPNKTYLMYSHTAKKQTYNRDLLLAFLEKKIRLVDYEYLVFGKNQRAAFGRFAGIVGAYNGLRAYGLRNNLFDLTPAYKLRLISKLEEEVKSKDFGALKIILTGKGGRVGTGAKTFLDNVGFKCATKEEFMGPSGEKGTIPTYLQIDCDDYAQPLDRKSDAPFNFEHFFSHGDEYETSFPQYLSQADLLIAGAFWDPKAPVLFTMDHLRTAASANNLRMKVVSDITCDIKGSVATTIRPSVISNPFYDIDLKSENEVTEFTGDITVSAVDCLPNELSMEASEAFADQLMEYVIPELVAEKYPKGGLIDRASITVAGQLNDHFKYLQSYVDGSS